MHKSVLICALAAVSVGAALAKTAKVEYECDDGHAQSGYRIRVVELSRDVREMIVLKKANGSASLVGDQKLKADASGAKGQGMSFKKSVMDADGNWTGTFTLSGKRGSQVVRASCGRVETITL
jgi:hypothetical protein